MDNLMLEKIKDLIAKNDSIGIAVGRNPGIDEMAGALALYLALTEAGKKTTVACPTEPLVEVASLVGIDRVKKNFEGDKGGDLTVSFPYKEGEIEKISYTLEEGKLNILVKAGEQGLTFNDRDVKFRRSAGTPGLVIIIGTPRLSDLGSVFDAEALKDSKVINIDYKAENQGYGDIPLIGRNSSSVSELVTSFINSLGFKMDIDIASNLLSGIVSATDNFQKENTNPLSLEMAALLMKKGAVRQSKNSGKRQAAVEKAGDSFFTPKPPSFEKTQEGTAEKKPEVKLDENNPPDDWLAPKIYKGSTTI